MMRSITACVETWRMASYLLLFEDCDRLVGELELVGFAVMKQLHDDGEQLLAGREIVGQRAASPEIVGCDGVGLAHHLRVQHPHSTLDQHVARSSVGDEDKSRRREQVPLKLPVFADAK